MIDSIGIFGQGFVGSAIREGFRQDCTVCTYDKRFGAVVYQGQEEHTATAADALQWVLESASGPIFLCLPTPMQKDGRCDTGLLDETVQRLDDLAVTLGKRPVVVIKSTVEPGTTARLHARCRAARVCFNPEFLREATFVEDFKNQDRIVLGGPPEATAVVAELFQRRFPGVPLLCTDATTAEMVKYVTNAFLALKVSFANEIKGICDRLAIDYNEVVQLAALDQRLGASHWSVPGPDGKPGFSGSCFPKDLNALMHLAASLGALHNTLQAAWSTNLAVRPERDWEQLHGRAVNYK